jgi:hypothetical protein
VYQRVSAAEFLSVFITSGEPHFAHDGSSAAHHLDATPFGQSAAFVNPMKASRINFD